MNIVVAFLSASGVIILDLLTKYTVLRYLACGQSISIIPNIFHLTLVLNKGAAFGLFKGGRPFFIALALCVILLIILYLFSQRSKGLILYASLGLVLGGAIGNLIDRFRFGYVVDFLDFRVWPVFNVADSCITVGTVIIIWAMLIKVKSSS